MDYSTTVAGDHAANEAERHLLDAMAAGRIADFTALPASERVLTAETLHAIIVGPNDGWPELKGPLRIRGADIVGSLCPLSRGKPDGNIALLFWSCSFDAPVDLSGADFLSLRFVDCTLPAFIGASLSTKADLDLSGSHFSGVSSYQSQLTEVETCALHLSNARIGGRLLLGSSPHARFVAHGAVTLDGARIEGDVSLAGARLDGQAGNALSARSVVVGGNFNLTPHGSERFEAYGEVALAAARITGDLNLGGAKLFNPAGRALHCEDLRVETVFLIPNGDTPFESTGRLNFLSATIGGSFFLSSVRLAPGPDSDVIGRGGPVVLNLQQVRVSNTAAFRNVGALPKDGTAPSRSSEPRPVEGWFVLNSAQLNVLYDAETGWPAPGYLDLEGATYERLRDSDGGDIVARRIAWLRLQFPGGTPNAATFRPQPYEELTRVLRRHGQSREADAIAVEKIRMRLAAKVDPPWARLFPKLLMLVSHHGYSSSRAVLSFLLFVLAGAAMYSIALWGFGQPFHTIETDPSPTEYIFAFGLARASTEHGCPGLDVLHYALDVALPFIDLGHTSYCRFAPEGPWRWFWSLLHSFYALAGTALSAVVVLTLTGVLRRD